MEGLATVLAGLSLILLAIASAAASRYRDARLAFVAAALGLFAVVGILALLHQVSPRYGGGFGVDAVPLALAVAAVALLYVALVHRRSERRAGTDG